MLKSIVRNAVRKKKNFVISRIVLFELNEEGRFRGLAEVALSKT